MLTFYNYTYMILLWVQTNYLLLGDKTYTCKLGVRSESRDRIPLSTFFFL